METITHILEENRDGSKVVKVFFVYPNLGNIMAKAHSYFSKDERKQAKLNFKNSNK